MNKILLEHWNVLGQDLENSDCSKTVSGHGLDIATVVLVSCHSARVEVTDQACNAIDDGERAFKKVAEKEHNIYGVNTGFGGSANTRTLKSISLKKDLLNGLLYGMLGDHAIDAANRRVLSLDHSAKMIIPESWARATMLVRINSLSHGASGISSTTVDQLAQLLNHDVTPGIPLRGSISASGDLSPLAYVAGLLEGNPAITAWVGSRSGGARRLKPADEALSDQDLRRCDLNPREALALVNGTSVSAGVAALAMHEAVHLVTLAQALTAMSVEGLRGTDESFDPFFSLVRPHWGQAESARNIHSLLQGSKLLSRTDNYDDKSLRQDRYSIRTASQWIGPILEDLALAHHQVTTELNCATDNPLVERSVPRVIHGGNFQAQSITSAMEKLRQAIQSIGRLLFTQCTEVINPATSRGLPPNLVFAEPSESYVFKGTDILIASLLSELGYLANPVTPHVQTAEMGNQALNSLALVSARYSMDALNVLKQLAAAHLVAICQALDLRVFQSKFLASLFPLFREELKNIIHRNLISGDASEDLLHTCWKAFVDRTEESTNLDTAPRLRGAIAHIQLFIIPHLTSSQESLRALTQSTQYLGDIALATYMKARDDYLGNPDAKASLGKGSREIYKYIRDDLRVPVMGPVVHDSPSAEEDSRRLVTLGELHDRVRSAMSERGLYKLLAECISEVDHTDSLPSPLKSKL